MRGMDPHLLTCSLPWVCCEAWVLFYLPVPCLGSVVRHGSSFTYCLLEHCEAVGSEWAVGEQNRRELIRNTAQAADFVLVHMNSPEW